jgi:hypothetical protein
VAGNKEPFQTSEEAAVAQALGEVLPPPSLPY